VLVLVLGFTGVFENENENEEEEEDEEAFRCKLAPMPAIPPCEM